MSNVNLHLFSRFIIGEIKSDNIENFFISDVFFSIIQQSCFCSFPPLFKVTALRAFFIVGQGNFSPLFIEKFLTNSPNIFRVEESWLISLRKFSVDFPLLLGWHELIWTSRIRCTWCRFFKVWRDILNFSAESLHRTSGGYAGTFSLSHFSWYFPKNLLIVDNFITKLLVYILFTAFSRWKDFVGLGQYLVSI